MNAIAQKANKVELISGKPLRLLYKETAVLLQQSLQTFCKTLLINLILRFSHHVPRKLLHIRGIVPDFLTDSAGILFAYLLAKLLDDASFSRLYNKVKNASFDDNKFDLIEVASLGCFYSCSQTARMMKMFTFSDKQLKVLRLMAPHIVDPENAIAIYDVLTFDSDKSKAGEIMRISRPGM
jgi:hypothetical protein